VAGSEANHRSRFPSKSSVTTPRMASTSLRAALSRASSVGALAPLSWATTGGRHRSPEPLLWQHNFSLRAQKLSRTLVRAAESVIFAQGRI
jgi:hypothetical protein